MGSLTRYRQGWKALNRLLHEDRSFSGNEKNCAFLNMRDGRFASISTVSGLDFSDDSRALALCDWDFDGKLDLWMSSRTAPRVRFMHNRTRNSGHFIAVQLEGNGTTTNRDAIGARVEIVTTAAEKSILTQHAGDGFLTQSSRWMHFGLGDNTEVKAILVHWPGGKQETYGDVESDQFYVINQASGKVMPWQPAPRDPIKTQQQPLPSSSQIARIIPPYHLPLPHIDYVDAKSATHRLSIASPTLVTVWSASCSNCLQEFNDWSREEHAFGDHELGVVVINADLDAGPADVAAREKMLKKMGFPFTSLTPTAETVRSIDYFQRALMDLWRPMPVPCSFLLDQFGRVVAIYKGPIELDQIWADMQLFGASPDRLQKSGLPFVGQWGSGYPKADPSRVATQMIDHTQIAVAIDYLQHFLDTSATAGISMSNAQQTDVLYMRSVLLASSGRSEEAVRDLVACRALSPQDFRARRDLAKYYIQQGNLPAAEKELLAAVQMNPTDITLRRNLSSLLLQQEKFPAAIEQLKLLLQQTPSDATAYFNLGNALRQTGQWERSLKSYRAALEHRPTFVAAANNLAWIMSTHPDQRLRDGKTATDIAEQMCKWTEFKQPSLLDTLAAAYAENGDYEKAVKIADRAISLMKGTSDSQELSEITQRRELYSQQKPYRDRTEFKNGSERKSTRVAKPGVLHVDNLLSRPRVTADRYPKETDLGVFQCDIV